MKFGQEIVKIGNSKGIIIPYFFKEFVVGDVVVVTISKPKSV